MALVIGGSDDHGRHSEVRHSMHCENVIHDIGTHPFLYIIDHAGCRTAERHAGLGRQRIELHAHFLEPC
jgi:hypothetical protein